MRTLTDSTRFLAALGRSHRMVTEVDVWFAGEPVVEGLAVRSGSVQLDRTAASLARCDLQLAEPERLPVDGGPLSPYGYEIVVRRGIRYPDGTQDLAPLGVFPIQVSTVDGVSLLTSVSALDRSQRVRDARLEDDYQIASGTNYGDAIEALIDDGVPGLEYSFPTIVHTTPLLTFPAQADRWDAARSMAKSIGHELYFDGLGRCCLRPEPDLSTAVPVWTIAEGDDGVLLGASVKLDRGPAYNRVVAVSANASNGAVHRGIATDDDPASPTYYYGPFGRKPRFYASPLIGSEAQADSAAAGILNANLGVARSMALAAITNPAIEPADPVLVRRLALGLDTVFLLDTARIGLAAEDAMTAESRARQEVLAA